MSVGSARKKTPAVRAFTFWVVRTGREVPRCAVGGLQPDLSRPLQLRRVRMQGPFALPVVEDARSVLPLFHRFAPVPGRQGAILLPCTAGQLQRAVAVSRNLQKTHGRRLLLGALRQGKLPPHAFDAGDAALVLDRVAKLLADDFHHGGGGRSVVAHAREAEEIGWKLRAAGVQDEGSAHPEDSAEQAGLEDDIISRRCLTGRRRRLCSRGVRRPVVLSEHERREVDFARQLEEAFQRGGPGIERCRPGFHVRDVFEAARQCLQQLRLLS